MTRNEVNIDEYIREDYKVPESVFDKKKTKTTLFMLQTIFPNNSLVASEYFVNAFIDDTKFKHDLKRCIFVLFKVEPKNPRWLLFANKVKSKLEFILEYFVGMQDGRHLMMMVFKVPERYTNEYDLFIEGRYSKFSEEYKKLFPQRTFNEKAQPGESIIWQALYKSEELRKKFETYFNVEFDPEDELWGKPEPKFEVYRYE
jgi:hypothetical protein